MRVIDPGHLFEVSMLDGGQVIGSILQFVKREGEKFPGNVGHYSGTTLQEVWRASIARLEYNQIFDPANEIAITYLKGAIYALELRAAKRHNRVPPTYEESWSGEQCSKCLHVGCKGECREEG